MHNHFYKLMQKLSKPSKVASTLDWKKVNGATLLSLNIHRDRIGIAVASHPSFGQECHELEPLRFADDHITIDKNCLERFQRIVDEYKVCGIVVSWPLQHDTGRMGAACGRVIYTLEEIMDKSGAKNDILSGNRPLCLWDSEHIIPKQREDPKHRIDSFGRCPQYGETTDKNLHIASEEQYHEDENTVVVKVWNDFCKEHWPNLFLQQESDGSSSHRSSLESSGRTSAYGTSRIKRSWSSSEPTMTANQKAIHLASIANKKSLVQAR